MLSKPICLLLSCSLVAVAIGGASTTARAEGPFDPTFAGSGLFPYSYWFDPDLAVTSGLALDSMGRLIVATSIGNHSIGKFSLGATRHLGGTNESLIFPPSFADGLPDGTFGSDGIASMFFDPNSDSYAKAVVVDHHDRIVVGGSAHGIETCSDGTTIAVDVDALVRLRNDKGFDGHADFTFGTFGAATYGDCSHATEGIAAFAVDEDDSVVATGSFKSEGQFKVSIVRWTPSGGLDNSFGVSGVAITEFEGNSTISYGIAIDGAQRILIAGQAYKADGSIVGLLSRYKADGALDSTFGSGGYVELGTIGANELGYFGYVCCVAIDSKNRAIVAGTKAAAGDEPDTSKKSAFVARFTDTGAPDPTFGSRGFVHFSSDRMTDADALAIDNHDRPLVAGNFSSAYFPWRRPPYLISIWTAL